MRLLAATVALACALCILPLSASGLSFTLEGSERRCLQEDVNDNALILGEYEVTDHPLVDVLLQITDSHGNPVYRKENAVKGKFAFSSDAYDVYEICFESTLQEGADSRINSEVKLNIKAGAEAKSYDDVAKAEKLKPLELTLRKLEDLTNEIATAFQHLKERETQHRDTNESTAQRLLHFSIFSMLCLTALATWQVLYLKRYFAKKKLI